MRKFLLVLSMLAVSVAARAQTPALEQPNGTPHSTTLSCTPGSAVSGVTVAGFNFYKATTSGAESGTPAINGATPTSTCAFTDTNVVQGQKAFYVVEAQSTTGNQSAPSNEVSATTPANPNPPTLSATIVAVNVVGKKETITAQYTDTSGAATAYELWGSGKLLAKGSPTVTANGVYTITWSGKAVNGVAAALTVGDAAGQVATTN